MLINDIGQAQEEAAGPLQQEEKRLQQHGRPLAAAAQRPPCCCGTIGWTGSFCQSVLNSNAFLRLVGGVPDSRRGCRDWQRPGRPAPCAREAGEGAWQPVRLLYAGLRHEHVLAAAVEALSADRGGNRGESGRQSLVRTKSDWQCGQSEHVSVAITITN